MREILFRGKRIDTGKWIEGSLVVAADRYYIYVLIGNELAEFEVDPKTVGEYTGLKDKNGIKIFEGDVVRSIRYAVVKWHWVLGGFVLYRPPESLFSSNRYWMLFDVGLAPYEVVGNEFDSPELLDKITK